MEAKGHVHLVPAWSHTMVWRHWTASKCGLIPSRRRSFASCPRGCKAPGGEQGRQAVQCDATCKEAKL